jgi:hypothetical protein
VISWDGPLGFNVTPRPTYKFAGSQKPVNTSYSVLAQKLVTQNSPFFGSVSYDIYSFTRFSNIVYAHGKAYSAPGNVLGAAMVGDVIVCVVSGGDNPPLSEQRNQDSVYFTRLSDMDTLGWRLAGTITVDLRGGESYLARANCYMFSQDGLSIISIVDSVYDLVDFEGQTDQPSYHFRRSIVRVNLSDDGEGIISVGATNFTVFDDFEKIALTTTINNVSDQFSAAGSVNYSFVFTDPVFIDAVGFIGNTESIVKRDKISHIRSASESSSCSNQISGDQQSGTLGTSYNVDKSFSNVISSSWVLSSSQGAIYTDHYNSNYSLDVAASGFSPSFGAPGENAVSQNTTIWTGVFSSDSNGHQMLYADVANDTFVFAETNADMTADVIYNFSELSPIIPDSITGSGRTDNLSVTIQSSDSAVNEPVISGSSSVPASDGLVSGFLPQPTGLNGSNCSGPNGASSTEDDYAPELLVWPFSDLDAQYIITDDNDLLGSSSWITQDFLPESYLPVRIAPGYQNSIFNGLGTGVTGNANALPGTLLSEILFNVSGAQINLVGSFEFSRNEIVLFRT